MKRTTIFCSIAVALLGLSSCVDNEYDLDNLDLTVGLGKDLALPMSSLGDLTLGNVLELTNDVIVSQDNGSGDKAYYLSKEETASLDPVTFERVEIAAPTLSTDVKFGVAQSGSLSLVKRQNAHPGALPTEVEAYLDKFCYTYTYHTDETGVFEFNENSSSISDEVISLERFDMVDNTIKATIKLKAPSLIKSIQVSGFKLTLPQGLNVTACRVDGKKAEANVFDGRTLTLDDYSLQTAGMTVEFDVDGVELGEESCVQFDSKNHSVKFAGSLNLSNEVKLSIRRGNLDLDQFEGKSLLQVIAILTGTLSNETGNIGLHAEAGFKNSLCPEAFYGELEHQFEEAKSLDLGDLPDFLTDDDVVLDLANPAFFVKASYGMANTTVKLEGVTLTSIYNDPKKEDKLLNIPTLTFQGGQEKVYCIAKERPTYVAPEGYTSYVLPESGVGTDLASLIRSIPDKVTYSLNKVNIVCNGTPIYDPNDRTMRYPVALKYHIYSPLQFGNQFTMVYRDTTDDWHKDIIDNEVSKYKFEAIKITATVKSELPLDAELEVFPIDTKGKPMKKDEIETYSVLANGTQKDALVIPADKTTDITFYIKPSQTDYKAAIEKLNGVIIQAKASYDKDETLQESQNLKVTNLRLSLVGTVIADLN